MNAKVKMTDFTLTTDEHVGRPSVITVITNFTITNGRNILNVEESEIKDGFRRAVENAVEV